MDMPRRRANTRKSVEPKVPQVPFNLLAEQIQWTWSCSIPEKKIGQGLSNIVAPKFNKDKVSNPKPLGGSSSGFSILACPKCGKSHSRKCLAGMDGCFGCGKSGHKMRDCLLLATNGRDGRQAKHSGFGLGAPHQSRLYALQTRQDHKGSLNVMITSFMDSMNRVFRYYLHMFIIVFTDDSLIYSWSDDEHVDHLRIVLRILKDCELYDKFSKYEYLLRSVAFIGSSPMKVKFLWSEACEKSFQELKDRLISAPIFTLPKGSDDFVVYCDALHIGLSCILMKHGKVIAYDSRKFKVHEKNYPTRDLELAMVVFSLKILEALLIRYLIDVCTDHKILKYVFPQKDLNFHQRRWLELMKDYDMSTLYHWGKGNVVADALSRLSMGSVSHIKEGNIELVRDVHRLARLGVRLVDSNEGRGHLEGALDNPSTGSWPVKGIVNHPLRAAWEKVN
ncbi:hypothetical protein MTR67_031441 [Solanum verrucosum]|uniref:CCHC-type domain-containing protein n=1 Tax=Solanum verrucosum TaxID=315347 RepID=A0AAF0ZDS3_SOLVR|nr:hypothetical protein MTR67_031441 [Solanum verrucosum]